MFRDRPRRTLLSAAALVAVGLFTGSGKTGDDDARAQPAPARATSVPILMYHELRNPPQRAPYPELYVDPADFAAQLAWLDRHGFQAVTLTAVWRHWHRGEPLPRHPIVLTIDDGFRSTVTTALPALRRRGWPAVLNLALHHLDRRWGVWGRDVRALVDAGWEIGAHTLTHPDLTAVGDTRLEHEVLGSRRALQRGFGVPVDFFCYPGGRYDERVVAVVCAAGFLGAATTVSGLGAKYEPFTLRRIRVSRSDGVRGLASSLESWLGR